MALKVDVKYLYLTPKTSIGFTRARCLWETAILSQKPPSPCSLLSVLSVSSSQRWPNNFCSVKGRRKKYPTGAFFLQTCDFLIQDVNDISRTEEESLWSIFIFKNNLKYFSDKTFIYKIELHVEDDIDDCSDTISSVLWN